MFYWMKKDSGLLFILLLFFKMKSGLRKTYCICISLVKEKRGFLLLLTIGDLYARRYYLLCVFDVRVICGSLEKEESFVVTCSDYRVSYNP